MAVTHVDDTSREPPPRTSFGYLAFCGGFIAVVIAAMGFWFWLLWRILTAVWQWV